MKNKLYNRWYLICSIIQLIIGIMAIASFIVLALNGEVMTKWIATFVLAVFFVVFGITGIINYKADHLP